MVNTSACWRMWVILRIPGISANPLIRHTILYLFQKLNLFAGNVQSQYYTKKLIVHARLCHMRLPDIIILYPHWSHDFSSQLSNYSGFLAPMRQAEGQLQPIWCHAAQIYWLHKMTGTRGDRNISTRYRKKIVPNSLGSGRRGTMLEGGPAGSTPPCDLSNSPSPATLGGRGSRSWSKQWGKCYRLGILWSLALVWWGWFVILSQHLQ